MSISRHPLELKRNKRCVPGGGRHTATPRVRATPHAPPLTGSVLRDLHAPAPDPPSLNLAPPESTKPERWDLAAVHQNLAPQARTLNPVPKIQGKNDVGSRGDHGAPSQGAAGR